MAISTPFNSHLVSMYNSYWNSVTDIKLILLDIEALNLTPTTTLSAIKAAQIPAVNGYTTGGKTVQTHAAIYDNVQMRAEGRPPAISFTATDGPINFNAWAILATKDGVEEACLFYHYGADQIIAPGNTLEITNSINLGSALSDVQAPD